MKRWLLPLSLLAITAFAQSGSDLHFCIRSDPKTFDPFRVEDENSEVVRYLTGGVLLRVNRVTQQLVPELAESWKVDREGRRITFHLRHGIRFSNGASFSAEDVAYTIKQLMDPKLHAPTADSFRSSSNPPEIQIASPDTISITFGAAVSGLDRLFDQVAIIPAHSIPQADVVLGPFRVAAYKAGIEVLLERNPNYWKTDAQGRRLPYALRVHLEIQQNRDLELIRFRRGEIDWINSIEPDVFEQLSHELPGAVEDAGVSLESEMMWFNQAASAPLPGYKKAWFASREFRRAVSEAINREDLCRIVFKGHARPAEGPVSPANKFWFNASLKPHPHDVTSALHRLEQAGFQRRGDLLYDREGHPVEFALITNAGNRARERMAAMIQQDLQAIGIRVNVVTLDFPSLIERMTQSFQYEACLMGLTNVDLDPSAQMNVWLSSADNHQWNPRQAIPATPWEAEIDSLMRRQAAELRPEARKYLFDRVQQIVWEEEPFLYLVNKNSLVAFSPQLHNVAPAVIQPRAYWNIESLYKNSYLAKAGK